MITEILNGVVTVWDKIPSLSRGMFSAAILLFVGLVIDKLFNSNKEANRDSCL